MAHWTGSWLARREWMAAASVFIASGCGTYTKWRNRKEYDALMTEMRAKGLEIARKALAIYEKLPAKGSPMPSFPGLQGRPVPVFKRRDSGVAEGNTSIMHEGQLTKGNRHKVGWATSGLPYSLYYVEEPPGDDPGSSKTLREMFTADFARPYLVLVREVSYRPAEVISKRGDAEGLYRPGHAVIDAYLAELASEQVLTGVLVEASTSATVKYSQRKNSKTGEVVSENFADQLKSDLERNVHRAITSALNQATGGDIQID